MSNVISRSGGMKIVAAAEAADSGTTIKYRATITSQIYAFVYTSATSDHSGATNSSSITCDAKLDTILQYVRNDAYSRSTFRAVKGTLGPGDTITLYGYAYYYGQVKLILLSDNDLEKM